MCERGFSDDPTIHQCIGHRLNFLSPISTHKPREKEEDTTQNTKRRSARHFKSSATTNGRGSSRRRRRSIFDGRNIAVEIRRVAAVSASSRQNDAARPPTLDRLLSRCLHLHRPRLLRPRLLHRLLWSWHLHPQPSHRISLASGRPWDPGTLWWSVSSNERVRWIPSFRSPLAGVQVLVIPLFDFYDLRSDGSWMLPWNDFIVIYCHGIIVERWFVMVNLICSRVTKPIEIWNSLLGFCLILLANTVSVLASVENLSGWFNVRIETFKDTGMACC